MFTSVLSYKMQQAVTGGMLIFMLCLLHLHTNLINVNILSNSLPPNNASELQWLVRLFVL